jgi:hypothetical protein
MSDGIRYGHQVRAHSAFCTSLAKEKSHKTREGQADRGPKFTAMRNVSSGAKTALEPPPPSRIRRPKPHDLKFFSNY